MNEEATNQDQPRHPEPVSEPQESHEKSASKGPIIGILIAVIFFLVGFVPMWLRVQAVSEHAKLAEQKLPWLQMQTMIGSAEVDSRRGEYESARRSMTDFFTALTSHLETAKDLKTDQQKAFESILKQRDDIITLLARSDPASAERLSGIYVTYRGAVPVSK